MGCEWEAYLNLLPLWMRSKVDQLGRSSLLELRMRIGEQPELVMLGGSAFLPRKVSSEDITFTVNVASKYSPWSASTAAYGYITAPGGHRVGICGQATVCNGEMKGISNPTSVCLRVAREHLGIADRLLDITGSIMIIGKPGCGKTTLLRDLIRVKSEKFNGAVCVVDEKGELFPHANGLSCFSAGKRTDVICGCSKEQGINAVLRNMSPKIIAVDEITAEADTMALLHAGWCGVALYATAHAANIQEFTARKIYRPLLEGKLFQTVITMREDKTWNMERMSL